MASAAQDVQRTFNDYIDGLMSSLRWNPESGPVTFSFPDPGIPTFAPAPDALKDAIRDFANAVSTFTELKFSETSGSEDRNANIRIVQSDTKGGGATTDYPGGGNALFGPSYADSVFGNYWFGVVGHELGHALGLKEAAFSDGFSGGADFPVNVPLDRNDSEFAVMSYRSFIEGPTGYADPATWPNSGFWDVPQSYMMLDIAALQYLYGANFNHNNGDTVYSWDPETGQMFVKEGGGKEVGQDKPGANRIFLTIWDGNGTDTYDMSKYTNGVNIDLAPGAWSITSPKQLAVLSVDHGLRARGNVFNALQYRPDDPTEPNDPDDPPPPPDPRSLIENAIGGAGNDMILGNADDNVLTGGLGRDFLNGREGVDTADYATAPTGVKVSLRTHSGFDSGHAAEGDTLVLIENLRGSQFDDVLEGDDEANVLDGLGGDDLLAGLGGADILEGNQGGDTADYFRSFERVIVSLESGTAEGGDAKGDELRNIEGLRGSNFDDILTGDAGVNFLTGLVGADTLSGLGGDDLLFGGAGGDRLDGGDGGDTADYSASVEGVRVNLETGVCARGDAEGDELRNVEGLRGSNSRNSGDMLTGSAGANWLNGFAGDDRLTGLGGPDRLWGGEGDDVFRFAPGAGVDRILDFDGADLGNDRIRLIGFGEDYDTLAEVRRATVQVDEHCRITLADPDGGAATVIWLEATQKASLGADDFVFAA